MLLLGINLGGILMTIAKISFWTLLLTLPLSNISHAGSKHNGSKNSNKAPIENNAKNESLLNDVSYNFDKTKIKASQDAFHFLRSFVDYFYLVAKNNQNSLTTINPLTDISGWCVGDAHAENFGVLVLENNNYIFTDNDMDDSGPAPVIYDIYRLMVSSSLYDTNISISKMKEAYLEGLKNNNFPIPSPVQDMLGKAEKGGTAPSTSKVANNKIIRVPQMVELKSADLNLMKDIVSNLKNDLASDASLIDAVQSSKVGGGSGGLLRYELLINNGGNLLHLELKTEVTPSVYPVATTAIPDTNTRIENTIDYDQGQDAVPFYKVFNIKGQNMLLRPRFAGDVGVSLDKNSLSDNEEIIYYEAYTLGKIHSKSMQAISQYISLLENINEVGLEKDITLMENLFNSKYNALKNKN